MSARHRLGPFAFHGMWAPQLEGPQEHFAVETRAGLPGVDVWKLGIWSEPCEITTQTLLATYEHARGLMDLYRRLTTQGPQQIMIGGVIYHQTFFQVLAVHEAELSALVLGKVAGDSTIYRGSCVARWTLQPIALS